MKPKRPRKPVRQIVKHLWSVEVRHRDYIATANDQGGRIYMTVSTLRIVSPQPAGDRPNIDLGLTRAKRFMSRNRREYGMPDIRSIEHSGTIDE